MSGGVMPGAYPSSDQHVPREYQSRGDCAVTAHVVTQGQSRYADTVSRHDYGYGLSVEALRPVITTDAVSRRLI